MTTASPAAAERRGSVGLGWLVLGAVCWGTTGTLGTLLAGSSGLPLLAIAGYRILVGGLVVAVIIALTRRLRLPRTRAGWSRTLMIAACSAVYQVGFFAAIGEVGVALATLVAIGSAPLMVLAVDALTGQHRLGLRLIATLLLAAVGLVLLVGTPPAGVSPDALIRGVALAGLAATGFAGISLLGARPEPDFHSLTGTALAFIIGGVVVLFVAVVQGPLTFPPTPTSLGLLLALGLVPTAIGYLSYFHGLRTQSSTTGVLVALLEPITAAVLALAVLNERLTWSAVMGAALLLGAVGLTTTGRPLASTKRAD